MLAAGGRASGREREVRSGGRGGCADLRSPSGRCSGVAGWPGSRCPRAPSGSAPQAGPRPRVRGWKGHHAAARACSAGNTWWRRRRRLQEVAPGNGCRGTWVTLGLLAGGRPQLKRTKLSVLSSLTSALGIEGVSKKRARELRHPPGAFLPGSASWPCAWNLLFQGRLDLQPCKDVARSPQAERP